VYVLAFVGLGLKSTTCSLSPQKGPRNTQRSGYGTDLIATAQLKVGTSFLYDGWQGWTRARCRAESWSSHSEWLCRSGKALAQGGIAETRGALYKE